MLRTHSIFKLSSSNYALYLEQYKTLAKQLVGELTIDEKHRLYQILSGNQPMLDITNKPSDAYHQAMQFSKKEKMRIELETQGKQAAHKKPLKVCFDEIMRQALKQAIENTNTQKLGQ